MTNNLLFIGIGWLISALGISPMFTPLTFDWIAYFVILPFALIIIGVGVNYWRYRQAFK